MPEGREHQLFPVIEKWEINVINVTVYNPNVFIYILSTFDIKNVFYFLGRDIPMETQFLLPAGDVAYGLAWGYVTNYLRKVLPGNLFSYFLLKFLSLSAK